MAFPTATRRRLLTAAGGLFSSPLAVSHGQAREQATPVAFTAAIPPELAVSTNWATENLNLAATRDAKATRISAATVDRLRLAWQFPVATAGPFGALSANPAIAGDTLYLQDSRANVYALDKRTGELRWSNTYDDDVPSGGPNGVAPAYGRLYTTLGGRGEVVALDPTSGNEVWRTPIKGPRGEGITTFPLVHGGLVFVSTIPGNVAGWYQGGQRGMIHALDAASGEVRWYIDTTVDDLWGNPAINSGGGCWHPPAVDEAGWLYAPIGNPGPFPGVEGYPWGASRPGDNLFTDSVLKLDPRSGAMAWYYQVRPHDLFDLDNQLTPVLVETNGRKLALATGKHGQVVALDRASGELVWRTPVGLHLNDELTEIHGNWSLTVSPGIFGGIETQPALSVANNLLIVPVYELPTRYTGTGVDPEVGYDLARATGLLVALDITDGAVVWQTILASGPLAGATIANDVVFTAGLDGVILGFRVQDGTRVFTYQVGAGINAQAAISGDYLYVPAGGPLIPSSETANPPPAPAPALVALNLGDGS